MRQTAGAVLDDDEHVQHPERSGDRHEEVASENGRRVISQECRPALVSTRPAWRSLRQVLAHRPWRDPNAQLEQQLIGDPLFAPKRVLAGHPTNQNAQLHGNRRSTGSGPQSPEQAPPRTVPANEGRRPHDHESATPLEQFRQYCQAGSRRSVHPPRTDLPLHEQCQLTAQEKILGADRHARTEQQQHPAEGIREQTTRDPGKGDHELIVSHSRAPSPTGPDGISAEDRPLEQEHCNTET